MSNERHQGRLNSESLEELLDWVPEDLVTRARSMLASLPQHEHNALREALDQVDPAALKLIIANAPAEHALLAILFSDANTALGMYLADENLHRAARNLVRNGATPALGGLMLMPRGDRERTRATLSKLKPSELSTLVHVVNNAHDTKAFEQWAETVPADQILAATCMRMSQMNPAILDLADEMPDEPPCGTT